VKLERHFHGQLQAFCWVVVPTWTLLAALTAGLILGAIGSRLFQKSSSAVAPAAPAPPPPAPEEPLPPAPTPAAEEPGPEPQPQVVHEPEPPEPAPAPPAPAPEPVRISMEDVVSELERRYQGRQADGTAEKPRTGTRRRRPR
jgi:outer membrane biosynthesis protein TonB